MEQGIKKFDELNLAVSNMTEDMKKFYENSNKAAGTRVRKELQKLKNLAHEIRLDIQNKKKD